MHNIALNGNYILWGDDMNNRILLKRYYKNRLYKNRTVFARALDFIVLRLIIFAALYLWFKSNGTPSGLSVALSVIVTLMCCVAIELIKSIRLDRFIKKERVRLKREHALQTLLVLDRGEFSRIARFCFERTEGEGLLFAVQKAAPLDPDDVLRAYRMAKQKQAEAIHVFYATSATDSAVRMAGRFSDVDISLHGPDDILEYADELGLYLDAETLEASLIDGIVEEKRNRRKKKMVVFTSARARNYLLIALGLIALSFTTRFALYYRLMAGICITFAGLSWWTDHALALKGDENAPAG